MESKVDNQVAAPAETRTPNLHRAKIAHRRVRMEGWRQWQLGGREKLVQRKNKRTLLTPTGLLMEGVSAQNPLNPYLVPMLASPRRSAVVPILRHGRPSPWAKRESSRITVAECFGCRIWIIVNWQCSTAWARQPRAAFTSTPSINSLLGTAPSPA